MALTTIFTDTFASGDFTHTENGVTWQDRVNVSVITNFSPAGATGNCVRFFWGDGVSPGSAEMRFDLGGDYNEVEISWDQYFPDGAEIPTRGPIVERTATGNNKLLRLFGGENFAETAPRFGSETFEQAVPAGDEQSNLEADLGAGITGLAGTEVLDFLSDTRRGVWFNIRIRFKAETGAGAADGEAEFYLNDVLIASATGLSTFNGLDSSGALFGAGYLWGSQNGQYVNADTFTYLTNVTIAVQTSQSGGVIGEGVQGQGVIGFGVVGPLGVST